MTLFHRTPSEVYHVYGEDEYLADEGSIEEAAGAFQDDNQPTVVSASWNRLRVVWLVGLALMACVAASALGFVVLNAFHRSRFAPRADVSTQANAPVSNKLGFNGESSPAPHNDTSRRVSVRTQKIPESSKHALAIVPRPDLKAPPNESGPPAQVSGESVGPPIDNEFGFEG